MESPSFLEIEYKYVVTKNFDRTQLRKILSQLQPIKQNSIKVRDVYYVLKHQKDYLYRHRFDNEIQQLTVKSRGSKASHESHGRGVIRTEINLPIDQKNGDQKNAVTSFMETLGVAWQGEVLKDIEVSYFSDCEIVFYRAVSREQEVFCIEIEALHTHQVNDAIKILNKYEAALGFKPEDREPQSLFELLQLNSSL